MAIESDRIIQKMINELKQAKIVKSNQLQMKRHLLKVQVLCELMIEENIPENHDHSITESEIKAMIGNKQSDQHHVKQQKIKSAGKSTIYDEENDGGSLFDF